MNNQYQIYKTLEERVNMLEKELNMQKQNYLLYSNNKKNKNKNKIGKNEVMSNNYLIEKNKEIKKGMGGYKKPRGHSKTHVIKGPINQINFEHAPKSPLIQNKNKMKKKKKKINNKINNIPPVLSNNYSNFEEKNKYVNYNNNMNLDINNNMNKNTKNTKNISKINKKNNNKKKRSATPLNTEDKNIY